MQRKAFEQQVCDCRKGQRHRLTSRKLIILAVIVAPFISSCHSLKGSIERPSLAWKLKDFLITYCCSAPATEENVARAASEHFNLVPASEEALPIAAKNNVMVMLEHGLLTPSTARSEEKMKELDTVIDRVKDNPALGAYYIVDEPGPEAFPEIAKLITRIKGRDSKHLCFVNLLPIYGVPIKVGQDPARTYIKYVRDYIKTVHPELLSYDYYNFYRKGTGIPYDGNVYFVHLELIRQAAQKANIPFMNIIQASNFERDWRFPVAEELRWQVYTTLAYGGRGISYFLYWGPEKYRGLYRDGKPTNLVEAVSRLNLEMEKLGPVLMSKNSLGVYHTGDLPFGAVPLRTDSPVRILSPRQLVLGLFGSEETVDSFMIVNRDYSKPAIVEFAVQGHPKVEELDRITGQWREVKLSSLGVCVMSLEPGDGRFFRYH